MLNSDTAWQVCTRCVMDTTDPDIQFDTHGVCTHCHEYDHSIKERMYCPDSSERQLAAVIDTIKASGKGARYDCVVGISGGVDSCYTAYMVKQLGLRALLVHLDNGWDSEPAIQNIAAIVQKLGFDYESYVLDWNEFKHIQLAFLRSGIVDAEIPTDVAIPEMLHRYAARYGARYIISGGNYATEAALPRTWGYFAKDQKLYKDIIKKFCAIEPKKFTFFDYKKEIYYKFFRGIKTVFLLNYLPYNKKAALSILEQHIGWKHYGGKHHESRYTKMLQSYILPVRNNQDYRKATLSSQINAGEISREDALSELEKLPYDVTTIENEIAFFAKKLDLTTEEFAALLRVPPKTYRDFAHDEKKIEFIYATYRNFFSGR